MMDSRYYGAPYVGSRYDGTHGINTRYGSFCYKGSQVNEPRYGGSHYDGTHGNMTRYGGYLCERPKVAGPNMTGYDLTRPDLKIHVV